MIHTDTTRVPLEYFANGNPELTKDPEIHYEMTHFESVPRVGMFVHVEGATYPEKTIPSSELVYAINIVKEVIKQTVYRPVLFLRPGRTLIGFNVVCDKILGPYRLSNLYICMVARMVWYATSTFLQELGFSQGLANNVGYNLAHVFEWDDAYRFRVQDLATECDFDALRNSPRKELKRLMGVYESREVSKGTTAKTRRLITPVMWLLLIPKVRHAFVKIIPYIEAMVFDDIDWYWASFKDNYHFGGLTHAERVAKVAVPKMYKVVPVA